MINRAELERLAGRISVIRREIQDLKADGSDYICIARNAERMLASVNMLELEISDAVEHVDA